MKTQWPRSADEPGVYMAQTGTRNGEGPLVTLVTLGHAPGQG